MQRRVLLVDKASGVGGSVISLHQLVRGLDRARFEPVVLLAEGNPYAERFRALGAEVLTRPWASRPPSTSLRWSGVRDSGVVQGMRQFRLGQAAYHTAGFYVKQFPKIMERAEKFADLLRSVNPQLIHFNDVLPLHRGETLGAAWARVPAICHVRGFEKLNHFDRWLAPRLKRYIFISQAIANDFLATGAKIAAWDVVYNGVDLQEFRPMPEARAAMRQELGLPPDAKVAAMVGRLVPWKGQEVFLDALQRLAGEHRSLWGLLVGNSGELSKEYERHLRVKVDSGALRGRVVFADYRADVSRVLAAADILVHASVEPEPFGRVIVEGMASGVPVVASAAGAIPEIIHDGHTGLLFPPSDDEGLAAALRRLISAPELPARLRRNALRDVESRFSAEFYVAGVEAVYEAVR
jgi:glycosyltransferase involved in cell wall biosynthesis